MNNDDRKIPASDNNPQNEYIQSLVNKNIDTRVSDIISQYRTRARYFFYGLLSLFIIVTGIGLLDKGEFFRMIHEKIFPSVSSNLVSISYESLIELRADDPRRNSGFMSFYAKPGQKVMLYAYFQHRFAGNKEERRVSVLIDNKSITESPVSQCLGGFKDITDKLNWDPKFDRDDNVHQVGFELDEMQPTDLTDEINVVCVVLVYGDID